MDPDSGKPGLDYWEVFAADGTRYRFGHKEDRNGEQEENSELLNKVWYLTGIKNRYGLRVLIEYDGYHK